MAERRMFAKTIIDSDAFLDMPLSSQCLYFHLGMRADDDGFINNPKKIQRTVGASEDDLKLLIAKNFVIPFETGVVVIKHWKIHNYIQKDRYKETVYREEKALLTEKSNRGYTLDTECIHDGYSLETQVRVDKDRIDKDSKTDSKESVCQTGNPVRQAINAWNTLESFGIAPVKRIQSTSQRYKNMNARIREYGLDVVLEAIESVKKSDFLLGRVIGKSGTPFYLSFDWFVLPNNFEKVCNGKYLNREDRVPQQAEEDEGGLKDYE